jgi:hypothetical protein
MSISTAEALARAIENLSREIAARVLEELGPVLDAEDTASAEPQTLTTSAGPKGERRPRAR